MAQYQGWIKFPRSIQLKPWWQNHAARQLFVFLLLNANYTEGNFHGTKVCRGQIISSLSHISENTSLSIRSTRTAIKILEAEGELTKVTTNRFTLYTLVNYDFYQEVNSLSDKETDMTNVNNITIKELSDYI